ncbi:MAG: M48 family metalloprotease [Desulfobacterales bacterium]|nr:M48 family metalloprotease [Desulfobacterales bacterium]
MLPSKALAKTTRRIVFAVIMSAGVLFAANACTVKVRPVEPGTIPKIDAMAPGESAYGQKIFDDLCDDHQLNSDPQRMNRLVTIFDELIQAAEADHLPWNLHLFDNPEIIDVRAVHGNYVFVWSGFLDAAKNDDEIAAVMSCEIAHVLARHTYPVEFTLWTDVFFDVAELATSLAILQATQGAVMISGRGWMKWAYVELADLDSLDREYNLKEEMEATEIAMLIMERAKYSPEAMLTFWQRIEQDEALAAKAKPLKRDLTALERTILIQELLPQSISQPPTQPDIPDEMQSGLPDDSAMNKN